MHHGAPYAGRQYCARQTVRFDPFVFKFDMIVSSHVLAANSPQEIIFCQGLQLGVIVNYSSIKITSGDSTEFKQGIRRKLLISFVLKKFFGQKKPA